MKNNTKYVETVQTILFPGIDDSGPFKSRARQKRSTAVPKPAAVAPKELIVSWIRGLCNAAAIFELDHNAGEQRLDLYIILAQPDSCGFKNLEPFIRTATLGQWTVQFSLCQLTVFNERRKQGSFFHVVKCNEQALLYQAKDALLEWISASMFATVLAKRETDLGEGQKKGNHFFETAIAFEERKETALACFALHQAIEITLRGFITAFSGISPRLHSLKQLFLLCNRIRKGFTSFFQSAAELDALACLQEAYTAGRYNNDFVVADAILQLLKTKTARILAFTAAICKELTDKYTQLFRSN
ncbi:MAG: HEPN domain-containing protein [Niabella sp.]|nr:HEPN domain-containing protein [Niabella sp.]